ncbi:hypothetical protein PGT21_003573 [Puccinia graminis f. sp. tritici]|uniref:Uncharacterized protein n=1 Tax=Puccinia graminis f. sp. tritici TaxID=56615 RepID=A0A5B0MTH8_PUCGR|nr:hypothetical protein PGT21_003573 [Puccinia graminis f. sp. tritici]
MCAALASPELAKESTPRRKPDTLSIGKSAGVEMMKNWEGNRRNVVQMNKDSKEFFELHSNLQKQLDWIKDHPFHNSEQILLSIDLQKVKSKISLLKQWKLADLGKLDSRLKSSIIDALFSSHMEDIIVQKWIQKIQTGVQVGLDADKMWEDLGESVLNEMKHFLLYYNKHFKLIEKYGPPSFGGVPAWKYVFKIIDLLHNNGFINKEIVRSIFQDSEILKEVIYYAVSCFREAGEKEEAIWGEFRSITKQFHWKFLNDSFKVLSKKEEKMINLEFLSERIHFFGQIMNSKNPFPEWEKFSQEFKNSAGKMNLEFFHDQSRENSQDSTQCHGMNPKIDAPEEIKREIISLIWLLNNKFNSKNLGLEVSELSYAIFDYLDFIERHYFPEIIKETSYNQFESFDQFQEQKDTIILLSKTLESFAMEKCILNLFSSHSDHQIYHNYPDDLESLLEKHHKKSISTFSKFCEAYKKIERNNQLSDWLHIGGPAGDLKYTFEIGQSNIEAMDKIKTEITVSRKKNLENDTSKKRPKVM